ncbi:MAG TPA: phosphomannomutase/phosphoglucomutase [Mariprofundaceae bacterium]|nr:phosphomannomutase/phosphoglucomutase [Mariprofundaceae bacterium]
MSTFPHHIFREYDIRGIVGQDVTTDLAYRLGVAFAQMLPGSDSAPMVTGRDVRLSGPELHEAVMQGLRDAGKDVLDIGMVPTPLAYFAVFHTNAAGCIMITASHNPSEYNGFKLMRGKESLHGEDIQTLKSLILEPSSDDGTNTGTIRKMDIVPVYQDHLLRDIALDRPLKVVIDAGNGPSGTIAAPLYRAMGCEVIELFCEPDGRFPNHHPDPTVEANMWDISRTVVDHGADLGIAFDGDGDRIGIVDEAGKIVWGDMMLLLLARAVLAQHPGATIISEVKCSQHMYNDIARHGGNGIMWRTGHSPIKAKMKETGALLAGEMSGHMFFADRYFGFDDAVYAGARLMEVLAHRQGTLSSLLADVPHSVTTPEIRIECPDVQKFELVEAAKTHFGGLDYEIIDVDGMRLKFDDGWGLLRASNTQPSLVLRFEAPSEVRLAEMRQLVEGWLETQLTF